MIRFDRACCSLLPFAGRANQADVNKREPRVTEGRTDPYQSIEWSLGSLGFLLSLLGAGQYRTSSDTRFPLILLIGGGLLVIVSARSFWLRRRRQK
jgi:hypothetical protein